MDSDLSISPARFRFPRITHQFDPAFLVEHPMLEKRFFERHRWMWLSAVFDRGRDNDFVYALNIFHASVHLYRTHYSDRHPAEFFRLPELYRFVNSLLIADRLSARDHTTIIDLFHESLHSVFLGWSKIEHLRPANFRENQFEFNVPMDFVRAWLQISPNKPRYHLRTALIWNVFTLYTESVEDVEFIMSLPFNDKVFYLAQSFELPIIDHYSGMNPNTMHLCPGRRIISPFLSELVHSYMEEGEAIPLEGIPGTTILALIRRRKRREFSSLMDPTSANFIGWENAPLPEDVLDTIYSFL